MAKFPPPWRRWELHAGHSMQPPVPQAVSGVGFGTVWFYPNSPYASYFPRLTCTAQANPAYVVSRYRNFGAFTRVGGEPPAARKHRVLIG